MQIDAIYRYPVKGLNPEKLAAVSLSPGEAFQYDRIFAIAHGRTEFDEANPVYLSKNHFLVLMNRPVLAKMKQAFDPANRQLTLTGPKGESVSAQPDAEEGLQAINDFLESSVGRYSSGGAPRLVFADHHRFFDIPNRYLSLINLASVADLADKLDRELDPLRFRANLYFNGAQAWVEQNWVGEELSCGDVKLRVVEPIERCAATNVNLQTAEADANIPRSLWELYGHRIMGVYVEVIEGGELQLGDTLSISDI